MAINLQPPHGPLRKPDSTSRFLAKDLLIAYPMLDGGNTLINHGSWGSAANLTTTNMDYSKIDGLRVANFDATASASRLAANLTVPSTWSFAYWVKIDAAPTTEQLNVFSLYGPSEAHVRAWIDQQGLWSWQKRATADSYTILPISDYPLSNLMLVVSVFHNDLPPVQVRTNPQFSLQPTQPSSYTAFNYGQGARATAISSIYFGNNYGGSEPLNGSIGPFYFWGRALSESEIWQLWQDPYAPFRRSTDQVLIPSTILSQSSFSLEGIGKPTDKKPLFQDNDALTIYVDEYLQYVATPLDTLPADENGNLPAVTINITDAFDYQTYPSDSYSDVIFNRVDITINDSLTYIVNPADTISNQVFDRVDITVNDNFTYVSIPSDSFDQSKSGSSATEVITINETYTYQIDPVESVTSP